MGCNIHLAVEVRQANGWQRAEPMEPNPYASVEGEVPEIRQSWYDGRNYRLFAMLADVRNGSGSAGADTGDRIEPIADPRGLPDDASEEVRQSSERWGIDGHSHSYLTLAELLGVDWWGNESTYRGWIRVPRGGWTRYGSEEKWLENVRRSLIGGYYHGISAGATGQGIVAKHLDGTVTVGDTARSNLFRGTTPVAVADETPTIYEVEWRASWATDAGGDWFQLLARMGRTMVMKGVSPDDVRIVFWFNN